jgi:hypothetical protein
MPTSFEDGRVTDDDQTPPAICRPAFWQMIKYWYGGSLPARHNTWVLHDITCSTWVIRHFARWLILVIGPVFSAIVVLVPGPLGLRLYVGSAFACVLFLVSLLHILIDADRRAVRAGYSFNEPSRVRERRVEDKHRIAVAARRQKSAQRR